MASLALVLIHELAEPYPFTETSRGDVLDRVYSSLSSGSETDRRKRVEWALQAGGEVR